MMHSDVEPLCPPANTAESLQATAQRCPTTAAPPAYTPERNPDKRGWVLCRTALGGAGICRQQRLPDTAPKDLMTSNHMLLEVGQYARSLEEKLTESEAKLRSQKPPKDTPPPRGVVVDYHSSGIAAYFNELLDPYSGYHKNNRHYGSSSTSHFCRTPPLLTIMSSALEFPDADLLQTPVHMYFEQIDPVVGILLRPLLKSAVARNRHPADRPFGEVVLAVCTVASKYSDDSRALLDQAPRDDEHSAGWNWLAQVHPHFSDVQPGAGVTAGSAHRALYFFLYECWSHVGVGLQCLKIIGAENPEWYQLPSLTPLDAELYNRVFWILVFREYIMTVFKGRVGAITSFDAPPPTTPDYEYGTCPRTKSQRWRNNISSPARRLPTPTHPCDRI
uniref:Transcription factor domain-containing protein n=1 Tax=Mycena chlorophos TaxID=658473 RepID=A0ABQ0KUA5_MYCCL|nr:predicted protein [Mycena chlorophos]